MSPSHFPSPEPFAQAEQLRLAAGEFARRFTRQPRFAAIAPGRVNLIGEHTDYNDGFVLPIAIDRQALITAAPTAAPFSTLVALDLDETLTIDLTRSLQPQTDQRWANYLLGVVQQFTDRGLAVGNLDLVLTSTIPPGGGLSSSAAIEVAVATILEQHLDTKLDPTDKALLCRQAEHAFPGTPCGIMDMFTAVNARPGHALLLDCRSLQAQAVPMPPADEAVLLIADTGVKHELAAGDYADRRATCEEAARALGLASLRDATIERVEEALPDPVQRRRAGHVVSEIARTLRAAEALKSGDLTAFGDLMFASHESLRDDYEVSCRELDVLVDAARAMREEGAGVYGARMTGGGFGGCAIVLCRPEACEAVTARLGEAMEAAQLARPSVFATHAAGGARAIPVQPG